MCLWLNDAFHLGKLQKFLAVVLAYTTHSAGFFFSHQRARSSVRGGFGSC